MRGQGFSFSILLLQHHAVRHAVLSSLSPSACPATTMDAPRDENTGERMDENSALDRSLVSNLLRPVSEHPFFLPEERRHPWRLGCRQTFDVPLLRIWDRSLSGSQPDANNCMMARAPRQRLDTAQSREDFLAMHINHATQTPTPFISFTTSAAVVRDLADKRIDRGRVAQYLTAIDPNVRVDAGVPILDFSAEVSHYNIENPYGGNRYCDDHYLCLWEVSAREVVGHWRWDYLAKHPDWYPEIVMPAFEAFRNTFVPRPRASFHVSWETGTGKISRKLASHTMSGHSQS